ncbi:MAG TPA: GNAT family protein [Candidatus Bathyarchaeia archaeon]|nr:GNAT family protein [Candidatus Bathyarchaeia archaeon]
MDETNLGPCTLEGKFVRLEPLRKRHLAELFEASKKLDWGWMLAPLRSRRDVVKRVEEARRRESKGEAYVFAVHLKQDKRIVGSTSYFGIVPQHKRAEIGYTWYEQDLWGTFVNPECKFLLLRHAFEDWHANRIQISTDVNNAHSQKAILKLGASYEGTLRHHSIRPDGSIRDTMTYSITSDDWPRIKPKLKSRIDAYSKMSN